MSVSNLDKIQVQEQKPDHHYRTEIPNVIFEWLRGEELIVYINLKRTAGDFGRCWKSVKTLATECGVSERTLQYLVRSLSKKTATRPALITSTNRKKSNGGWDTNLITINDIWRINGDYFRNKKIPTGAQDAGGVVQDMREGGAPYAPKEDPYEQDLSEETPSIPPLKKIRTKNKEDWWRGGFIKATTRELFEKAWSEYEHSPKGSVKNIGRWLEAVISRIMSERDQDEIVKERIERHRKIAEKYDNYGDKNTIVATQNYVDFVRGSQVTRVNYDMPDDEWTEKTFRIFQKSSMILA